MTLTVSKYTRFFVLADQVCDYVPLLSIATNLIDLFQKCVVIPFMYKKSVQNNHYYAHLNQKSFVRCIVLSIPIPALGNILVGVIDFTCRMYSGNNSVSTVAHQNSPDHNNRGVVPSDARQGNGASHDNKQVESDKEIALKKENAELRKEYDSLAELSASQCLSSLEQVEKLRKINVSTHAMYRLRIFLDHVETKSRGFADKYGKIEKEFDSLYWSQLRKLASLGPFHTVNFYSRIDKFFVNKFTYDFDRVLKDVWKDFDQVVRENFNEGLLGKDGIGASELDIMLAPEDQDQLVCLVPYTTRVLGEEFRASVQIPNWQFLIDFSNGFVELIHSIAKNELFSKALLGNSRLRQELLDCFGWFSSLYGRLDWLGLQFKPLIEQIHQGQKDYEKYKKLFNLLILLTSLYSDLDRDVILKRLKDDLGILPPASPDKFFRTSATEPSSLQKMQVLNYKKQLNDLLGLFSEYSCKEPLYSVSAIEPLPDEKEQKLQIFLKELFASQSSHVRNLTTLRQQMDDLKDWIVGYSDELTSGQDESSKPLELFL